MSDTNQRTIQAYEGHVPEYVNGTFRAVDGIVKDWLDETLADQIEPAVKAAGFSRVEVAVRTSQVTWVQVIAHK